MTFQSTITPEQEEAIRARVTTHNLSRGLGNTETACSIAAINLALTGTLTDKIPDCMSPVIGHWIIRVQDAMSDAMRNSAEWRQLLPLAAGTGRELEAERLSLILDWMWVTVLPSLQDYADKHGFGDAWRKMCTDRTGEAADAAKASARAAAQWLAAAAAAAAVAAKAKAEAEAEAEAEAWWRRRAASGGAVEAAQWLAVEAAQWLAAEAWKQLAPADLLRRLIECEATS